MVQRINKISHVFFILVITCISMTNAGITSESSKFDFPPHIIGVNYSSADELKGYMKYNPVDLGIDIYDDDVPIHIRKALANATLSHDPALNQYSPNKGIPRLLNAVAKLYSKLLKRPLDPEKNVLITVGAYEAVFSAFHGHTNPGDEWIVIEPAYSMYLPILQMARAVPRFTTLKLTKRTGQISGEDWRLDRREMESLFTNKTKGILLNNPLNPIGKVYELDELMFIAKMAIKYNTLVISDEAHEWITHKPHIRIATLPGMFERTITIGSGSKSFSVGGWRIGWAYGPEDILNHVLTVHSRNVYSSPTPQQEALAFGFEEELRNFGKPDSFFAEHNREVKEKRDLMVKVFNEVGMPAVIPDGGFCFLADHTKVKNVTIVEKHANDSPDMNFMKWFIKNIGVLGLPLSSYYSDANKHLGVMHARYCFHKKQETLNRAIENLQKLKLFQ